jgi:orotate phosphoribosyltransferase
LPSPAAELACRVHERSFLTGEFTLRSGARSTQYIDKYAFEADPALLRDIAEARLPLLPNDIDVLAGLELGGIPVATVLENLAKHGLELRTLFTMSQLDEAATAPAN